MRTTIYLTDEQVRGLAAYCGEEQISRAEAVRHAIDLYIRERKLVAPRGSFSPDDPDVRVPYRL